MGERIMEDWETVLWLRAHANIARECSKYSEGDRVLLNEILAEIRDMRADAIERTTKEKDKA